MKLLMLYGFLGSGKTTLIEMMLEHHWTGSTVILENEAGERSIDSQRLMRSQSVIVDIRSGCVCCTLRGTLAEKVKYAGEELRPDTLIVEPSGLAALSDLYTVPGVHPDAVVALADVCRWKMLMRLNRIFYTRQYAMAPVIILSRQDAASAEEVEEVRQEILRINPHALLLDSKEDLFRYSLDEVAGHCAGFVRRPAGLSVARPVYETETFTFGPMDEAAVRALKSFLDENISCFVRVKGIIYTNFGVRYDIDNIVDNVSVVPGEKRDLSSGEGALFVCWSDSGGRGRTERNIRSLLGLACL